MGLDMYLHVNSIEEKEIFELIGTWRKANQIRDFFSCYCSKEEAQENIMDLLVTKEMIEELEKHIIDILTDKKNPESVLPTSPGFFFGSLEYDHYYYGDLIYTLTLTKIAKEYLNKNKTIYYSEWW